MGKKGSAGAAAQRAAGVPVKKASSERSPLTLAVAVAAVAILASCLFLNQPKDEQHAGGTAGPSLQELMASAKKHISAGHLSAGISDVVQAQKQDVNSAEPAELLATLSDHFSGPDAARHARSAVRAGMEKLEMVLYDELHRTNELHDTGLLVKLARLKLMHHSLDDPKEAHDMLVSSQKMLIEQGDDLRMQGKISDAKQVSECIEVSKRLADIVKDRRDLTSEVRSGRKAADVAARILPSPPFRQVDRRAGLSLQEYRDEYLANRKPVILTDYAEKVFGGDRWSWDEMTKACGDMEVILSERSSEARHLWGGLGHRGANQSLGNWMRSVRDGSASSDNYLMDWGLAGRCDAALQKFVVPKYFAADLWKTLPFNSSGGRDFFARHPSVFVGAAGSGGALHVDSYASTFWQLLLQGRKRWTFYALPDKLRRTLLYAGAEHEIMPLTPAIGEKHDSERLPLLDIADEFKVVAEVGAGELMIAPHDVPHMVENIENVLAVSMNTLDDVAVPRLLEDLHSRSCFSDDSAIRANMRILEAFQKETKSSPQVEDTPFAALGSK